MRLVASGLAASVEPYFSVVRASAPRPVRNDERSMWISIDDPVRPSVVVDNPMLIPMRHLLPFWERAMVVVFANLQPEHTR